jgi:hypothetical protein
MACICAFNSAISSAFAALAIVNVNAVAPSSFPQSHLLAMVPPARSANGAMALTTVPTRLTLQNHRISRPGNR